MANPLEPLEPHDLERIHGGMPPKPFRPMGPFDFFTWTKEMGHGEPAATIAARQKAQQDAANRAQLARIQEQIRLMDLLKAGKPNLPQCKQGK